MRPLRASEEKKLLRALTNHGARGPWVSPRDAWNAFKEYARQVELDGGTGLLFQVGTYDFSGRSLFYFDAVCQFEILDAEGEFESYEQLHCELTCQPDAATDGLEADLWSFEFVDCDD